MVTGADKPKPLVYALTPSQQRSRRLRNIAIGLAIGLLVVIFYAMTIAKMGAGFIDRPI